MTTTSFPLIPRHTARKYRVIPVFKTDNKVAVAIADPSDLNTIDSLTHLLNAEIELRVASEPDIEAALTKYYGGEKKTMDEGVFKDVMQELTEENVAVPAALADDGAAVDADAPLIRLVNQIIVEAFKMRASDIHLEPLEKRFRLRYRIDGLLHEMKAPPKRLQPLDHRAAENPVEHVHLRAPHPAGRAHPDAGRQQAD